MLNIGGHFEVISVDDKIYQVLTAKDNWEPMKGVSCDELIKQLSLQELKVSRRKRIEKLENTRIPSLVLAFYYTIYKLDNNLRVPTQFEYIEKYFNLHHEWINQNNINKEGLKGRLSRAYPSLIRELEFYLRLKESKYFEKVLYDLDDDLNEKIDITIIYSGNEYGLQLRINSKNSNKYYEIKKRRGTQKKSIELIDMPFDKNTTDNKIHTSGAELYLYPENTIDKLIETIEKDK